MNGQMAIYLDHNASAPLLPQSRVAILDALALTGNPSSVHGFGRALSTIIERARESVAKTCGAERDQVVFTGSATESITQAIVGGCNALGIDKVVTSAGEHAAVVKAAEATGLPVQLVDLLPNGLVDLAGFAKAINEANDNDQLVLVAVQAVNNETGVVQPIEAVEALVGPTRHFLFVDGVQAFCKRPLDFAARASDMMAISAHKIGGPAGVGALLVKPHCNEVRLIPGGGQEQGRRGGTASAALIAGFGAAAEEFGLKYDADAISQLVSALETGLKDLRDDVIIFGDEVERVGNVVNFAVPGLTASVATMGLDLEGVAISSGSACSSGKVGRSKVLQAMGVSRELAECGLRASFGWSSNLNDVNGFLKAFTLVLERNDKEKGRAA